MLPSAGSVMGMGILLFFYNANHPALRRYRPLREPRSCRRGSAQKVPTSGHTMLTLASLAWHPLDRLTMLCHSRSRSNLLSAWIRRRPDPGTLHAVKECLVGVLAMDSLALLNQSTAAGFKLMKNMSAPILHSETTV